MPTKTQAIKSFLLRETHPDLAAMYNQNMEVQVNVAPGNGERVQGEYRGRRWIGYTDGDTTWKPFRIPRNADTNPEYEDTEMRYSLPVHAEGIGMTGWDWQSKLSRWVAFDFDAVTGHSERHTRVATQEDLKRIREAVMDVDWVTVRYSTSGKGLHLYVMLPGVPTQTHTEHAALARSILAQLSGLVGFDFLSKVDTCGGNMWVWHRKMRGTRGLTIIKQGNILTKIPDNWKQHLNVIRGHSTKMRHTLPGGEVPEIREKFDITTSQHARVPLDDDHRTLINYLNTQCERHWWWDADRHMLITHTLDLKSAHEALNLRGIFETSSSGSSDQNCFAYPMRRGAWSVRRYTLGVSEHQSWMQDGKGWTTCYLNKEPDLRTAALAYGGLEDPSGGFQFQSITDGKDAGLSIGADINVPAGMHGRGMTMKPHKDGKRIVVEIPKENHDTPKEMQGWLPKGTKWTRIFTANIQTTDTDVNTDDYDDMIRHLVDPNNANADWVVNSDGIWHDEPLNHAKSALESIGLKSGQIRMIVGSSVLKPWKLVVRPFEPEYPGNREWNRRAPQFRVPPADGDDLNFPSWKMIFNHVGKSLNPYVMNNHWCKTNGLSTGADYLYCWVASMIQYPLEPLPYLFIYGEQQQTGKSTFHEALRFLFSPGYVRADQALQNASTFNGELEGAILCVVEEIDLQSVKTALNRVKDWVTAIELSIHRKTCTPYHVPNTTHWIQCANPRNYCPVFAGDTRITMIHVENPPEDRISKRVLFEALQKETSDFLAYLLKIEIPECDDRLRIPTLETADKTTAAESNRNLLEVFLDECCYEIPGAVIPLAEFYERFKAWLDPSERFNWTSKQSVSRVMPARYPKGRLSNDPAWHWGNISFNKAEEPGPRLVAVDKKLIEEIDYATE